jgi:hypothetical protein
MAPAMNTYSNDHKFSKLASEQFAEIGHWDFVNPILVQPWGSRSQVVARIRIFEKYLTDDDVHQAFWVLQQAVKQNPNDYNAKDAGLVFLNQLLEERSAGKFWEEMKVLAKSLPTPMQYADEHFGVPSSNEIAKAQRAQMAIVTDSSVPGSNKPRLR